MIYIFVCSHWIGSNEIYEIIIETSWRRNMCACDGAACSESKWYDPYDVKLITLFRLGKTNFFFFWFLLDLSSNEDGSARGWERRMKSVLVTLLHNCDNDKYIVYIWHMFNVTNIRPSDIRDSKCVVSNDLN